MDLEQPFTVEVKVIHPEGFHQSGAEVDLPRWGLPNPFPLIQKAGVPRRYPVSSQANGELTYRAVLNLPVKVQPVLPAKTGETPFQSFRWTALAKPQGEGTRLELSLDHTYTPSTFGFEQKEKGLQIWKQDRSLIKSLHEDGLAFKAGS
jgi:hypothetical protein